MYNIIHIIDNLGIGGAQTMLFELYHALKKHFPQHPQQVVYMNKARYNTTFVLSSGISPIHFDREKSIAHLIQSKKNPVVIYHKLASSKFKVLDYLKARTGVKIIVINHTLYNTPQWKSCKSVDVMVAVSNNMREKLKKWYPSIRNKCVHNGFNQWRCDPVPERDVDKSNLFYTGRINRICGWKHSDRWLKWCSSVKLPMKMKHEYIGDRPAGNRRKTTPMKGVNQVEMICGVSDFTEKISILKSWDVFLYETNQDEGVSMAILESLACGIPVICSNHYGNKEIIEDGINGYVFKNREAARSILKDLIKNPDKLKRLKESTRAHFRAKLDAGHMAKGYINIIDKLYGKEGSGAEVTFLERFNPSNKKFTILTSSFDKGEYLLDWGNSILRQNYRPLEVVCADDMSTDDTSNIIKDIGKKFYDAGIEFKLVNNTHRLFCGSSYHNLTNFVTGAHVGVLDADDMLEPDAVSYVMDLYNKYPDVAWLYTQFQICDVNMKNRRRGFCCAPTEGDNLLSMGDKRIHGFGHWRTYSYKIERPDKLFGRGLKCGVDKYMGYRLEEFGPGMFADRVCYRYRQHPVGSPKSVSSTKEAIRVWDEVRKEAKARRIRYNHKAHPITVSRDR